MRGNIVQSVGKPTIKRIIELYTTTTLETPVIYANTILIYNPGIIGPTKPGSSSTYQTSASITLSTDGATVTFGVDAPISAVLIEFNAGVIKSKQSVSGANGATITINEIDVTKSATFINKISGTAIRTSARDPYYGAINILSPTSVQLVAAGTSGVRGDIIEFY